MRSAVTMYSSVHGTDLSPFFLLMSVVYSSCVLGAVMVKLPNEKTANKEDNETKYEDEESMLEMVFRVQPQVTTRRPALDNRWLVMAPQDQGSKMFISTHEKPFIFVKK
ncbi:uncharacterized protein LOC116775707 isoform X2 [Danaus plexippus]|uniref:uncharacterized protein LOC116775707 isoform X2 n=1 Tax=Danaus plexippus TaxID=13037 RepID=UPI002AB128CB|nr:uncharacterized protein LOC116775707 isoform X2 [Danaus plexippus]